MLTAQGRNKTRSLQSEVILALGPGTVLNDAFKRFGVTNSTTSLVVVHIGPQDISDLLLDILGEASDGLDFESIRDMSAIAKIFGFDESIEPILVQNSILGTIALAGL